MSKYDRINLEPTDSCGVGMIADSLQRNTRRVLETGLTALCNVAHRGAIAADGKTGDGCGIMTDIPVELARQWISKQANPDNLDLFGVGVLFLPRGKEQQDQALRFIKETIQSIGLLVSACRKVPVNEDCLGEQAKRNQPSIFQIFVTAATQDRKELERKLFIARRTIELSPQFSRFKGLHIASLSCQKIVYKAMVQANSLQDFYPDLAASNYFCNVCIYHQRFSTNTSPSWSLCQPFRMLAHNGEINTIRGNRNWMTARESSFDHPYWTEHRSVVSRIFNFTDSDSASLDNSVELLTISGRNLPHAINMLIPPAWQNDQRHSDELRSFFEFHSCFCEPWDGPAAVIAFDGNVATATLDRNGLRPLRYKVTTDGLLIVGSEVGADRVPSECTVLSDRLGPGESLAIDFNTSKIVFDHEIKESLAHQQPYSDWLKRNCISMSMSPSPTGTSITSDETAFLRRQICAGVAKEEVEVSIREMACNAKQPTFSMGVDTPLAVLSHQPRQLSDYFKQRFAQVTNPPIDPIRERTGMSLTTGLGPERNLLAESPDHCRIVTLENPILLPDEFVQMTASLPFRFCKLDCTWDSDQGANGLQTAIDRLISESRMAVEQQNVVLILSDREIGPSRIPVPMLMAVGAVHHGLNKTGQRMMCSLIAETSDVRDPHQLALLFGYGCTAVYPYLAYGIIQQLHQRGALNANSLTESWSNYRLALSDGLLKIMSKMGISVLNSYQGAQMFETIGIGQEVIDKCFKYSFANLGGIGFEKIASDCIIRHRSAYESELNDLRLFEPGLSKPKRAGEHHVINGKVTKSLHRYVRAEQGAEYDDYRTKLDHPAAVAIRDLLLLNESRDPIPIDDVEPIELIRKRFTTAAMSMGAISPEATKHWPSR